MRQALQLFGTDGIRGPFGESPFLPHPLSCLGEAIAFFVTQKQAQISGDAGNAFAPTSAPLLIARDTRLSCPLIEATLSQRLHAWDIPTLSLGVLPTPALAYLTKAQKAPLGIMISASHNPFTDNGLKFFNASGDKLSSGDEEILTSLYVQALERHHSDVTKAWPHEPLSSPLEQTPSSGLEGYCDFLSSTLPQGFRLDGLKLVVDCAHGAAFQAAPAMLRSLGAQVLPIAVEPNGRNINHACGALFPQTLQKAVLETNAYLGIAFDGDGDRLLFVDGKGRLIDGEQILAFLAICWQQEGLLIKSEIVSTVMANQAFEGFLNQHDIRLTRTPVGDRHITRHLIENDLLLGGEPSGHLILKEFQRSGDALLVALHVLRLLQKKDQPAHHIFPLFTPLPQILHNIPLPSLSVLSSPQVTDFLLQAQERLKKLGGRILVRPSGTEPLLRILVEGKTLTTIQTETNEIVRFFSTPF